ncbi:sensor domain-containing diguanylate cyclase [Actimicrobium antarcticum]|uniref:diguanylate cyclase n=1 Tax=Actimicrobium antarcticum TaxID=1051899 RepID=A0ABP7SKQ5_9BURK
MPLSSTQSAQPNVGQSLPDAGLHVAAMSGGAVNDPLPDTSYDDIIRLANLLCGTAVAVISLTGQKTPDLVLQLGESLAERVRDLSVWSTAGLVAGQVLMVPDLLAETPPSEAGHGLRLYAAAPLIDSLGTVIGTLCVFDPQPGQLSATQQEGLRLLARQVVALLAAQQKIAHLSESLEHLEILSATDALTGLHNRRAFEQRIRQEFERARRYGAALSFLMLDVDFFKHFNDLHGHQAGDRMLRKVARTLQAQARGQDTLARFGGEEFAVVLPNTDRFGALVLAERYRVAIEALGAADVTVSIGVAMLDASMQHPDDLVSAADLALYRAKGSGRNKVIEAVRDGDSAGSGSDDGFAGG